MPSLSGTTRRRGSGQRYGITQAAGLAAASYSAMSHSILRPRIRKALDAADVQAYMLDTGLLLIPGSNSAVDYLRYNVRLLNVGGTQYKVKNGATGQVLGRVWHQGFLAHAMLIHKTFKDTPPTFIIGHSLGAASAQVLSLLWGVPAIGFAAPRIYAGGMAVNNSQKCLCLWRGDDPVGQLPSSRFRHAGLSVRLGKSLSTGLLNHNMRHYTQAISDPNHRSVVPERWPVTA